MNAACPSLHSDFFSKFFVEKCVFKRILKLLTFLDTTEDGVLPDKTQLRQGVDLTPTGSI